MKNDEMDLPCKRYHTEIISELGLEDIKNGNVYVKFQNFLSDPHIHRFSINTPVTLYEVPDDMLNDIKQMVIKKNTQRFDL